MKTSEREDPTTIIKKIEKWGLWGLCCRERMTI